MIGCEWIVCERSGRWAAALRLAIGRQARQSAGEQPVHEVRGLEELSRRLAERPHAVVLVEVRPANLGDALAWLADAGSQYPPARCVALMDSVGFKPEERGEVLGTLLAAGAAELADSPRRLQHVIALGRRHAASCGHNKGYDGSQPFAEWARALLPWQRA